MTGATFARTPPVRGVRRTHLRLLVDPFVSRLDDATAREVARRLSGGFAVSVAHHPQVRSASGLAGATVRGEELPVDAGGEFLGTCSEVVFGVEPGALRVVS